MRSSPHVVLCLSRPRWSFIYQRPQHLLTRCARDNVVLFLEEPKLDGGKLPQLEICEARARVRPVIGRELYEKLFPRTRG